MSAGGGKIKYWEYHGSIAGVVCNGPVDVLHEIIVDGESAWTGPLTRGGATNFSTITLDSRRVVRFYWGTEAQTVDPLLSPGGNNHGHEHPAYKGVCYLVLVDFFFGRERTSAPNIEVVVSRKPQQSVFDNGAAGIFDGQASPVASLADFFTHPRHGLGLAASGFDLNSWFATADQLFLNNRHPNTYISALLNQQVPVRQAAAEMALNTDLWLRFNPNSEKIEVGAWPHEATIDVSGLPLLTAHELTERPRFEGGGWGESETGWAITFTDRDRGFKETTEKHDDLRALRIVGDHRRATLKRPWIMRRKQAFFHVTEYGKSRGQPLIKGELTVRRVKAIGIRPGDLIRVDIDPEPGGTQVQQVFRVTERTIPQTGAIKLRIEAEVGISPVIHTPVADLPQSPQALDPPNLSHVRIFELPPALSAEVTRVAILAERPHDLVTGFQVHFDSRLPFDWLQPLGTQEVFALRGQPSDEWFADSPGPFLIEIHSTRDLDLIDDDPGPTAARNNHLLMVCAQVTPNGTIAMDPGGTPILEIFSIESFHMVGHEAYQVSALRGRFGTLPRAFSCLDSEVWIIPSFGLTPFEHRDFASLQAALQTCVFRLQPFSFFAQRELSACTNRPFRFSTAAALTPRILFDTPATSPLIFASPPGPIHFQGRVLAPGANLSHFALLLRSASGAESTLHSVPINPTTLHHFDHTVHFHLPGAYCVVAQAQSAHGRIREAQIAVSINQATAKTATPLLQPSGATSRTHTSVTIQCPTPGATILYRVSDIGDPALPGSFAPYSSPIWVPPNHRLWAYASAPSLTDSDYARADFYRDEFNNKGDYVPPGSDVP